MMKVWMGWGEADLQDYSIRKHLLFDVVAMTPERELTRFEKVFVARNAGISPHKGYLDKVYKACGCFVHLKESGAPGLNSRERGDLAWAKGDFDEAEKCYSEIRHPNHPKRSGPHDDRLLRLALVREQWELVVRRFVTIGFMRGFTPGTVVAEAFEVPGLLFLTIVGVALNKLGADTPPDVGLLVERIFDCKVDEFHKMRQQPDWNEPAAIEKLKKRIAPRAKKFVPMSLERALELGKSPRASRVLRFLFECDQLVNDAQTQLQEFGESGDEENLRRFIEIVTASGITSVSHTFLFAAMGHDSFNPPGAPPERMIQLYSCHPVMNKRHFGKLLALKFQHRLPISSAEVLTGLFHQRGSLASMINRQSYPQFFTIAKLAQFREWAEARLTDWLTEGGSVSSEKVADVWRNDAAQPVRHIFGGDVMRRPDTPRNMREWEEMLNEAARWLERHWLEEIGTTTWVSENQLYQLLKRRLKGFDVVQHAQPSWLSPQHLDVFVPATGIAIEYMGIQHFEPISFFGGEPGFAAIRGRDADKLRLCKQHGVRLEFVRYDENVGVRVRQIVELIESASDAPAAATN